MNIFLGIIVASLKKIWQKEKSKTYLNHYYLFYFKWHFEKCILYTHNN